MFRFVSLSVLLASMLASGCAAPRGATIAEKQAFIRDIRDQTLNQLYASRPDLQRVVERAAGYAVVSNTNVHVLLLGGGQGYGIAVDNRTGQETFMRMATAGAGPGLGVRDMRQVLVFADAYAFKEFVSEGWEVSGDVEAAATSDEKGGAVSAQALAGPGGRGAAYSQKADTVDYATSSDGVTAYRITKAGVALQVTIAGAKYWPYYALN